MITKLFASSFRGVTGRYFAATLKKTGRQVNADMPVQVLPSRKLPDPDEKPDTGIFKPLYYKMMSKSNLRKTTSKKINCRDANHSHSSTTTESIMSSMPTITYSLIDSANRKNDQQSRNRHPRKKLTPL